MRNELPYYGPPGLGVLPTLAIDFAKFIVERLASKQRLCGKVIWKPGIQLKPGQCASIIKGRAVSQLTPLPDQRAVFVRFLNRPDAEAEADRLLENWVWPNWVLKQYPELAPAAFAAPAPPPAPSGAMNFQLARQVTALPAPQKAPPSPAPPLPDANSWFMPAAVAAALLLILD